ncbi:MAG TPA: EcsC family protein [Chondromyces sp.]|nr:EcsC family protein [Chondromyces sp.]
MKAESKEELLKELTAIEEWENDQKQLWIWERIGRLPFKLLDKITPRLIQEKISLLLDELGNYIQTGGRYLTKERLILSKIEDYTDSSIASISDVGSLPLKTMNQVSEDLKKGRKNIASVQGATTGIGGIFTLAADIPLLLGLSLKTLQEIAITYGYDPTERKERIFIVKCMQFASADVVGKKAILNELSSYYDESRVTAEMISQLQGWREVVFTYRDQFGWKKLLQMIPVAGMVFGAFTNRSMIQDVSEAGIMLYRKRRIMERLQMIEAGNEKTADQ